MKSLESARCSLGDALYRGHAVATVEVAALAELIKALDQVQRVSVEMLDNQWDYVRKYGTQFAAILEGSGKSAEPSVTLPQP